MNPRKDADLDPLKSKHIPDPEKGSLDTSPSIERLDKPAGDHPAESTAGRLAEKGHEAYENARVSAGVLAAEQRERVAGAARYIRDGDTERWVTDARELSRQHPGVVIGGLALAGFFLGGVIRATFR